MPTVPKLAWPVITALCVLGLLVGAQAQDRVYRCGNEYTNNPRAAKNKECKPLSGGNLTVVPSKRLQAGTARASSPARSEGSRVDSSEQRVRDSDSRSILEAELKKAERKLADLKTEYNQGVPEKMGSESKNYQKYLDRVEDLKQSIVRTESDIAGIKRELGRVSPASSN